MKAIKAIELREKNMSELTQELIATRREQLNLRVQRTMGESPKSDLLRKAKLKIARIKTIMTEKGTT